jgi:hypothetical protein
LHLPKVVGKRFLGLKDRHLKSWIRFQVIEGPPQGSGLFGGKQDLREFSRRNKNQSLGFQIAATGVDARLISFDPSSPPHDSIISNLRSVL